jgi:hypothetical protein
MLFVSSGHQSEKVSFNIWYCLKEKEREKRKKKSLHEKSISRQGNESLVFS